MLLPALSLMCGLKFALLKKGAQELLNELKGGDMIVVDDHLIRRLDPYLLIDIRQDDDVWSGVCGCLRRHDQ